MNNFKSSNNLILAYFRQSYEHQVETTLNGETHLVRLTDNPFTIESLHLAWSQDSRHWQTLNNNNPIWPQQWMRDPFIARGADGAFHLLATEAHAINSCLYARSTDLISWQDVRSLPLMQEIPQANNVWAPEWFYDSLQNDYLLIWSSSFEDHGWKNSRLWACRTPDFRCFSKPFVIFVSPT